MKSKEKAKKPKSKKLKQKKPRFSTTPLYVAIVVLFVLYILFQHVSLISVIFGVALFLTVIVTLVIEVMQSFREEGAKKSLIEIAAAVLVVIIFWFLLQAVLGTPYPLDVVPSCSMLPTLQRGDIVVLRGIGGMEGLRAPVVNVSTGSMDRMLDNLSAENPACVAYKTVGNTSYVSQSYSAGDSIGLYESTPQGGRIVQSQAGDLVKYNCGIASMKYSNGTTANEAYTTSIQIGNTTISENLNNSVIVYQTIPLDLFYKEGDTYIVHRVYAIIHSVDNYYFLTKGDNNPGLDMQFGNYPANLSQVEGGVLASVPYLGYLKLAFSSSIATPQGCNSTVQH